MLLSTDALSIFHSMDYGKTSVPISLWKSVFFRITLERHIFPYLHGKAYSAFISYEMHLFLHLSRETFLSISFYRNISYNISLESISFHIFMKKHILSISLVKSILSSYISLEKHLFPYLLSWDCAWYCQWLYFVLSTLYITSFIEFCLRLSSSLCILTLWTQTSPVFRHYNPSLNFWPF